MISTKKNILLFSAFFLILYSCVPYQNIEVSKTAANTGGPQTLIYCLPQTRIDIDIVVTKTITKAGPYAQFAEKFLSITGVPKNDSEAYEISEVKIEPVNEPDPGQFYAITYKTYPSNLEKLFLLTQQGLMLDLSKSWNSVSKKVAPKKSGSEVLFDYTIWDQTITEDIDTLYKTILTDASFVKVPIYKKSLEIKDEQAKAEDMANLILKIRKRRLKLMMGEYDYHPEGEALKVIVKELNKQEAELMSNFTGKEIRETRHFTFSIAPESSASKELFWFSGQYGVSDTPKGGFNAVSASISIKENVASPIGAKDAEKAANNLFFRTPAPSQVSVKLGNSILADAKIPVYQAGKIQQIPVMP